MSQPLIEPELDTLATERHNNLECRELLPQLNDFENLVFGPDFACELGQIQPWTDSGCLLYSAVTGEAVPGRRRIVSALSLFVTTEDARDRVLRGEIADFEMPPWTEEISPAQPILYLSSVVSAAPHHLTAMYDSLLRDVEDFRKARGITFRSGFAVCTGAAGGRHMAKSGFQFLPRCWYRRRYELMVIDTHTAVTPFWRELFGAGPTLPSDEQAVRATSFSGKLMLGGKGQYARRKGMRPTVATT